MKYPLLQSSLFTNRSILTASVIITCLLSLASAVNWDISKGFLHPRIMGAGGAGIAYMDQPMAADLNPALLGVLQHWSLSGHSSLLEGSILSNRYAFIYPLFSTPVQFSYYSQSLSDIPITDYIDERIRSNGSFSEGISQYRLSIGKKISNFLWFKDLDLGYSIGTQRYSFSPDSNIFSKWGIQMRFTGIDPLYFGIIGNQDENVQDIGYGVHYKTSGYSVNADWTEGKAKLGFDYSLNPMLSLRAGAEPRYYSVGLGFRYDRLYGLLDDHLGFAFDYCYLIPMDPSYSAMGYFAFTLQEQSRLEAPTIYHYPPVSNQDSVVISGWGTKLATLWVNVNGIDQSKTIANENGQWEALIALSEGQNQVKARAIQTLGAKNSPYSAPIHILKDTVSPVIRVYALMSRENAQVTILPNKPLQVAPLFTPEGGSPIVVPFLAPYYQQNIAIQELSFPFSVLAMDIPGNKTVLSTDSPLIQQLQPEQKLLLTTKDKIVFSGSTNPFAEIQVTSKATSKTTLVSLSKTGHFEQTMPLKLGKNLIILQNRLKNATAEYPFTIIRLFRFTDVRNEDLDKLATIGVLDRRESFNPLGTLSQKEAIKYLGRLKEIPENEIDQTAFTHRWLPEKDNGQLLTRKTAMELLARSLGLDIYSADKDISYFKNIPSNHPDAKIVTYFVQHGFIPLNKESLVLNEFVTREEFVGWLLKTDQCDMLYHHYFKEENYSGEAASI